MSGDLTLKAALARYLDPGAFKEGVPDRVKFTCKQTGRVMHDKLKDRRERAMKRAECAIRFLSKPENLVRLNYRAQGIDARSGETGSEADGLDPKDESPVAEGDAPTPSLASHRTGELK